MSGPDQPAEQYRPQHPQDGVEPDESETTVVDARALGADSSGPSPAGDVPQAWSNSPESAPTTGTPYPRTYRPVDDEDPTDAPLADTPGTFGGAPVPDAADVQPVSPYADRSASASPAASAPDRAPRAAPESGIPAADSQAADNQAYGSPAADSQVSDSQGADRVHRPELSSGAGSAPWRPSAAESAPPRATAPQAAEPRLAEPQPTRQHPTPAASSAGPGSTAAYQPFQSTAQPAVAPFPSSPADAVDGEGAPDDATRVLPTSDVAQDPFARPYPPTAQPMAQPEYIPAPPPQPAAPDERDTFIGQPARGEEPDLLPEKRRIWQNLLGALIGLVLVLGPIVGFALLAGTPDSLFDAALARRFLLLGIIVVAAAPALLAGWAPATAWLPGGILTVVGTIAFLSNAFTLRLRSWSRSLFDTEVAGTFLAQYAAVIGFVLLFAGLGAAWARNSGAESVVRRIPTRS